MKYSINDVPSNLRPKLTALVDCLDAKERYLRKRNLGIAASVILALSVGGTYVMTDNPNPQPTEITPRQAAKETERALKIFAQAVDRGKESAKATEKNTQGATKKAFQTLNKYSK